MATLTQSVLSTQYVQVQIRATKNGAAFNPATDVVALAFVPFTRASPQPPVSADWHTGSWESDPDGTYWAQILVGPANGGLVLAVGSYRIYVRVTDSPEVPVLPAGTLQITS